MTKEVFVFGHSRSLTRFFAAAIGSFATTALALFISLGPIH
jgi:hypothetical protein